MKCWTIGRGVAVGVCGRATVGVTFGDMLVPTVAVSGGIGVAVGIGASVGVRDAVGARVIVGYTTRVAVNVGVGEGANATRVRLGVSMNPIAIDPLTQPSTRPAVSAKMICCEERLGRVTVRDYSTRGSK